MSPPLRGNRDGARIPLLNDSINSSGTTFADDGVERTPASSRVEEAAVGAPALGRTLKAKALIVVGGLALVSGIALGNSTPRCVPDKGDLLLACFRLKHRVL
jgi:hypothetical protein